MAFKSTAISMTTTPQLIVGGTSAGSPVVDITNANPDDPVQVYLTATGANVIYLQGSNTALGAAPALFQLSTGGGTPSVIRVQFTNRSDQIWAGTTAAGGVLTVAGTRQNSA